MIFRRVFVFFVFLVLFLTITSFALALAEDLPKIEIPRHVSYIVGTDEQAASFILSPLMPSDFMIYLERNIEARNDLVLENSDSVVVFPQREKGLEGHWGGYVDYPHVRLLPTHPLYFYVRWKEEKNATSAETSKEKVDLHLLYAAKRVVELERLLEKSSSEEVVKNTLERHKYHVGELFHALKQGRMESKQEIAEDILKTEIYILDFERKMNKFITDVDLREEIQETVAVYQEILDWIEQERGSLRDLLYGLSLPKTGSYSLLLKRENLTGAFVKDPYREGMITLGPKQASYSRELDNNWAVFKPIEFDKEQSRLIFTLPEFVNLASDGSFEREGESFDAIDGQRAKRLTTIDTRRVEIPINNYNSRLSYEISFYYKTLMGGNLDFIILGEDISTGETMEITRSTLPSSVFWDEFSYYLGPTYTLKSPKIVFEYPGWVLNENMSLLDNLVINVKWEPELVLLLTEGKDIEEIFATQREKTNLSFDKLDLFEYRVAFEGLPKDPFFLVLNQTFHEKQRLSPGLFCNRNDFWCKVFGSWGKKPLGEQSHFEANGFANGWLVDPKIVSDNKFTIEFWFQKIYYLGLGIIILTFLGGVLVVGREKLF